jgi:4'-phosphopantetheinyl transferase
VLWLLNIQDRPDKKDWLRTLGAGEAARFANFIRPERRRQFLFGRMLLRHAVRMAAAVSLQEIDVIERPGSSPQLVLANGMQPPCFSLSHSREWVACAMGANCHVGADIEVIDPERDIEALAGTAFYPDEHAWLTNQDDVRRVTAFYRMWTLKEALFKLQSSLCPPENSTSLVSGGQLQSSGEGWFACFPQHAQLSISICSTHATSKLVSIVLENLAI